MDDKCNINYDAILTHLKNQAMLNVLLICAPDNESKEAIVKMTSVFVQNGVTVDKAVKILIELNKVLNEGEEL